MLGTAPVSRDEMHRRGRILRSLVQEEASVNEWREAAELELWLRDHVAVDLAARAVMGRDKIEAALFGTRSLALAENTKEARFIRRSRPRDLVLLPCTRIRVGLGLIYSSRSMERIFDPLMADVQRAWFDATVESKHKTAAWLRIRGYGQIAAAVSAHAVALWGRRFLAIWKLLG